VTVDDPIVLDLEAASATDVAAGKIGPSSVTPSPRMTTDGPASTPKQGGTSARPSLSWTNRAPAESEYLVGVLNG